MEIIYPRDTRHDSASAGVISDGGGVVTNSEVNQTFNDFLTQHFSEDNSSSIIETINIYGSQMPDIGVEELMVVYMAKFEAELKRIRKAIKNIDLGGKLVENHAVIDIGAFTWNGQTQNIYMLSGGVGSTITINQYINNVCGVALFGSVFITKDVETGLIDLSLYPVDYIQTLLENNQILTIGADKYVPLTICDISVNDNELGDQIVIPIETEDKTEEIETVNPYGFLYNFWVVDSAKLISSNDDWHVPQKYVEMNPLSAYLNANEGNKLKSVGTEFWNDALGTDDFGFNAVGAGMRNGVTGDFVELKDYTRIRSDYALTLGIDSNTGSLITGNAPDNEGASVRLCKTAVGVANGVQTTYTGNNGIVYSASCVNEVFWSENLRETKFRDGSNITNVQDGAEWLALVSEGFCTYNNEPFMATKEGGVVVVNDSDLDLLEVENGGLTVGRGTANLTGHKLSSLLLRKI